jgi:hypothetical protein
MEQVIRSFLPWEAIAKKYFVAEQVDTLMSEADSTTPKEITFEDDSDDEEETKPKLTFSDETETIQFHDLDEKLEEEAKPEVEEDLLKEIESKLGETLVLNL